MHGKLLATTSALLAAPFFWGSAASVNQLFVFGDSLSDNGNAAIALGGSIPGNYAPNEFTDGPTTSPATTSPLGLWDEQFAAKIGVTSFSPVLTGGTNYAVASAQTGTANLQDIGNQVGLFTTTHLLGASSTALYAIWGGANDLFHGTNTGTAAADNLFHDILTLSGEGAKNFLWLNLPNLGDTPLGSSAVGPLNSATAQFNGEWASDLATLKSDGVNVIGVDINSLFNNIVNHPGSYGLSNVSSMAQDTTGNPNSYLFWDQEHPTTAADALIADAVYADYTAPATAAVPEPVGSGLLLIGLGAVLAALKLRRKTAS